MLCKSINYIAVHSVGYSMSSLYPGELQ